MHTIQKLKEETENSETCLGVILEEERKNTVSVKQPFH